MTHLVSKKRRYCQSCWAQLLQWHNEPTYIICKAGSKRKIENTCMNYRKRQLHTARSVSIPQWQQRGMRSNHAMTDPLRRSHFPVGWHKASSCLLLHPPGWMLHINPTPVLFNPQQCWSTRKVITLYIPHKIFPIGILLSASRQIPCSMWDYAQIHVTSTSQLCQSRARQMDGNLPHELPGEHLTWSETKQVMV